jgi:hypothetical protein
VKKSKKIVEIKVFLVFFCLLIDGSVQIMMDPGGQKKHTDPNNNTAASKNPDRIFGYSSLSLMYGKSFLDTSHDDMDFIKIPRQQRVRLC